MIGKGNTHNNGAKLAAYMTMSKEGERAELWQLRGFEATNIKDAFRDVQIMSKATKCEKPFFHLQLRNREGETLTREQWEYAADRIEGMLGLSGQPRAIVFHTYEHNNDEHMHVAWSRIDEDRLTAKPLPFFKDRLKTICRELEQHFALEPVPNHRKDEIKYAPNRSEQEQARRLGFDVHEIRATIRACFDQSDCGLSFRAALEHEGFGLAKGERRDYVVVDHVGGIHVLGKRNLDMTAAKIRDRLSDIPRDELQTVDEVRESILNDQRIELQASIDTSLEMSPLWDRDRDNQDWENALVDAAIEQVTEDDRERGISGDLSGENSRGADLWDRDQANQDWENAIVAAAIEKGRDEPRAGVVPATELKGVPREIREAREQSDSPKAFHSALLSRGFLVAHATKTDAVQSQLDSAEASIAGKWAPTIREGQIVIITQQGHLYPLTARNTGKEREEIAGLLPDPNALPSIEDARRQINENRRFHRPHEPRTELNQTAADIRLAYNLASGPEAFKELLEKSGLTVAAVTASDIQMRENAKWISQSNNYDPASGAKNGKDPARHGAPRYAQEGDVVVIDKKGNAYELGTQTTGDRRQDAQAFVVGIGNLPSIEDVQTQKQRARDIEQITPRGRWATGPLHGGMVEHNAWAIERAKALEEQRAREDQRRVHQEATKSKGDIDPSRYLTDPDYRREIKANQTYKSLYEQKAERENELRSMMEQQDRQR
jgi:hypothetical protein